MRLTNYNVAASRLLPLAVCVVLVLSAFVARQVASENTLTTVLLIFCFVIVPVGILPALILPFFTIFWVELGDELVVCTLLGTRRFGWAQVRAVRAFHVETEVTVAHVIPVPLARHRFLEFQVDGGKRYRVKVREPLVREVDGLLKPRGIDVTR